MLQEANLNGKSLAQTMVDNGFVDEAVSIRSSPMRFTPISSRSAKTGDSRRTIVRTDSRRSGAAASRACRSARANTASTSRWSIPSICARRKICALRSARTSMWWSRRPSRSKSGSNATTAATTPAWRKSSSSSAKSAICSRSAAMRQRRRCGSGSECHADHPLRRLDPVPGDPGSRERHSLRAVRARIQNPLPRGRRALRNGAAAAAPGLARHFARQGDGEHEHRRAPPAAGWPHPEEHRRPHDRHACLDFADAVRRERRACACSIARP